MMLLARRNFSLERLVPPCGHSGEQDCHLHQIIGSLALVRFAMLVHLIALVSRTGEGGPLCPVATPASASGKSGSARSSDLLPTLDNRSAARVAISLINQCCSSASFAAGNRALSKPPQNAA